MNTILVVADDPVTTKLLTVLLRNAGYAVTVAHAPNEALEITLGAQYDLLLLDVMLPGMDGLQLCQRIRRHSTAPILFVSARGEVVDIVTALEAGGDDYLTKPFDLQELLARVEAMLRRTRHTTSWNGVVRTPDLILDAFNNTVQLVRRNK